MSEYPAHRRRIGRNVFILGLTSFFTDISSEMIYPLIQAFVASVMGTAQAMVGPVLGVIEGIAEATASILKTYSGHVSDRMRRRKPLAIGGYGLSALSKLLFLLAGLGWWFILIARFADRTGKGIRTAPRDALIAESVHPGNRGRAYGFHRAMDYSGALLGVLICYFIVTRMYPGTVKITDPGAFYRVFLISLIPALIGVLVLFLAREKGGHGSPGAHPLPVFSLKGLDGDLKIFFAAVFIFTLGNSSNQFLLLRTMETGVGLPDVLLMYMLFNLTTTVLSTPLGGLSDRIGRKRIIVCGYALYAVIYCLFGFVRPGGGKWLWVFWALYGAYYALTEGIEKALVADRAPAERRGMVIGLFNTITGIGLLPASLIAGFLYSYAGKAYPFIFGSAMASVAVLIILFFLRDARRNG